MLKLKHTKNKNLLFFSILRSLEMYSKRIKWLMQSSRKVNESFNNLKKQC